MQEKAENITKVIYRLQEYVKYKGITLNQIAVVIGVSNSYFSKMANSGGSLGEDIIRKILLFYDELNSDWLIIGRGKMIKDGTISQTEAPDFVNAKIVQALADANKALSAANETILQQQEMIAKHTNTGIYTPPHLAESEAKHSLSPVDKE